MKAIYLKLKFCHFKHWK